MISYGRWIVILVVCAFIAPLTSNAYDIEFYRTLETVYPSGKADIARLNRTTLNKKIQQWSQIEWEPEFGVLQQGWLLTEQLGREINTGWKLTSAKSITLRSLPIMQSAPVATLPKLTPVKVLAEHQSIWSLSFQKSHGFVWWIDQEELKLYRVPSLNKKPVLSTSDIFKRKLFDLAAHPDNENFQVASSQGIYISRDGKAWHQIPRFAKNNLPVAFSSKGTLFVGEYRSQDEGQTFEPILKWDRIASLVIKTTRRNPNFLRVMGLESHDTSVIMTLGVGNSQSLKLISQDEGSSWEVLQTKPASFGELSL